MAQIQWEDKDSAVNLVDKFNKIAKKVEALESTQPQVNQATQELIINMKKDIEKLLASGTDSIGLYLDEDGDICQREVNTDKEDAINEQTID